MRGGTLVLAILVIVVGFVLFGVLLTSFDSMAYQEVQTIRSASTGVGESNSTIVLGHALYNANLDNVESISSTLGTDDPAPGAYNDNNDNLTVTGLTADSSRALTVTYNTARSDTYVETLRPFLPFFILLIFLLAGGGLVWRSFKGG
jgi:hypothetical protein